MEKARLHVIVHGRVQGIFFRSNTQKQASKLGLKGWVRNNPDRTVEVVAEGNKDDLKKLLAWCSKGPLMAGVENVEAKWEKPTGEFEHFSIRY
jgi:acylphosphatase